jgi:hypothetical protein
MSAERREQGTGKLHSASRSIRCDHNTWLVERL